MTRDLVKSTFVKRQSQYQKHFYRCGGLAMVHCHLDISHKVAKSIPKLISQLCGELQQAVWLSRGDDAI